MDGRQFAAAWGGFSAAVLIAFNMEETAENVIDALALGIWPALIVWLLLTLRRSPAGQ